MMDRRHLRHPHRFHHKDLARLPLQVVISASRLATSLGPVRTSSKKGPSTNVSFVITHRFLTAFVMSPGAASPTEVILLAAHPKVDQNIANQVSHLHRANILGASTMIIDALKANEAQVRRPEAIMQTARHPIARRARIVIIRHRGEMTIVTMTEIVAIVDGIKAGDNVRNPSAFFFFFSIFFFFKSFRSIYTDGSRTS